ncbi:MAG: response regulator [Actinomycetota bacterium]
MGARVLVIEDEPDIRFLTSLILNHEGHTVLEASTGAEGLVRMRDQAPDLVLLDIRLPDMQGWDVLKAARAEPETSKVPIVIMSAHSSGHTLDRAMMAGSNGYLVKPFKHEELIAVVKKHSSSD